MSFLPSFFVMQTNPSRPYLAIQGSSTSGSLHFVENSISSPRAKFAVEPSKSGGRELVHIRSCYNNKYWLAQEINGRVVIRASADEPVDDTNDPACTLFRPTGWSQSFSFTVINTRNLFLGDLNGLAVTTVAQQFHLVDWETLVILPSQVSFVSDDLKDHFVYSKVIDKRNYHRFDSGREISNIRVAHELFPTLDGNYRIRNLHFNKFVRNGNVWIWADTESNDNSLNALFSFVHLGNGVFALRNLGNNRFCGPDTREGKVNCLRAEYQTLTRQTRLKVLERVLERSISDITYRFEDSRIYQVEFVEVTHAFATNNTNTTDEMTLKFSIEESTTTSWKSSVTVTLGVKVQLRVTIIPVILKGKLEASAQISFTQEWEEVKTTTVKRELTYKVTIPPFSRRKVTLVCRKASCDVPYSYMQRDLLPDGRWVSAVKDDGIFYGVNSYDFDIESTAVVEDALGRVYL